MAVAPADCSTAYYSTRDDISNFKIRVRLRELSSTELISASPRAAAGLLSGPRGDQPRADQTATAKQPLFCEEIILGWQQKVNAPSRSEKKVEKCPEPNERKKRRKRRIYTYTQKDNDKHELLAQSATTSSLPDRGLSGPGNSSRPESDEEHEDGGDHIPLPEARQCSSYFIMADLSRGTREDSASGNCRALLCCLKYDPRGELALSPDFSHPGSDPYRTEGPGGTYFEYVIENASSTRPAVEASTPSLLRHTLAGDDWSSDEEADEGAVQLTVTGELTRLTQCSVSGHVYLSYALHLPPGWAAGQDTECEGVSAVCSTRRGVWRDAPPVYSVPLSFTVYTHGSGNGWPVLLVAAFAVDGDDGETDVGWTSIDLAPPCNGGSVSYAPLWSPAATSPLGALQRTFLHGCRLLPPAPYLAPYATRHLVTRVSRLGLVTQSTATLEYSLHTLLRSSLRLPRPGDVISQLQGPRLATKKALAALKKSRRRLRQVKQGVANL